MTVRQFKPAAAGFPPGWTLTVSAMLGLVLAGCAETPSAPIEDRNATVTRARATPPTPLRAAKVPEASPDYGAPLPPGLPYTVRPGDTLYSIAFRLGMDYRQLARLNDIAAPYTIFRGQELVTSTAPARQPKAKTSRSLPSPAAKSKIAAGAQADKSVATREKSSPAQKTSPAATTPKPKSVPKPSTVNTPAKAMGPVFRWLWPSYGKVIRQYSTNLHKGVDLSGNRGDPVRAVAGGVVVYSGTGVTGYGALLIIKHNEQYLSAYGHNDAILVEEGEAISAGQQIAQMGSSGTDSVKLHFEIRKQGKPVDPLKLLPLR